jgi:hypothetical protein
LINPVPNLHSIATEKLIASLLKGEGFIFPDLLKPRWFYPFLVAVKERLIGFLNPLADVLNGLRTYLFPGRLTVPQLGDVSLKFGAIQMLFEHPIIALMKGYALVPDYPSYVDAALEVSVPFVIV